VGFEESLWTFRAAAVQVISSVSAPRAVSLPKHAQARAFFPAEGWEEADRRGARKVGLDVRAGECQVAISAVDRAEIAEAFDARGPARVRRSRDQRADAGWLADPHVGTLFMLRRCRFPRSGSKP